MGKYQCARCGRQVKVRTPKGGDGSEVRPYPHRTGPYSRWAANAVRCDGHLYEAIWITDTKGDRPMGDR